MRWAAFRGRPEMDLYRTPCPAFCGNSSGAVIRTIMFNDVQASMIAKTGDRGAFAR
jgi:hypothetical protein